MAKTKQQIVLVEWVDSYGATPRWEPLDGAEFGTCTMYSAGLLLSRDRERVVIVPHWSDETDRTIHQGAGIMVIPTPCIKSITKLQTDVE